MDGRVNGCYRATVSVTTCRRYDEKWVSKISSHSTFFFDLIRFFAAIFLLKLSRVNLSLSFSVVRVKIGKEMMA